MKKILVIDYDQASLQLLHKALTMEGFDVVLAGDGQAGWEKFQNEKPDLVLMEAMLSKIHGFELCDRITKDPNRKVPVFIMTGVYKDRVYRTEALRTYGASEYFEKPLDMLQFVASIHAVLTVPDIKPVPETKPAAETKPGNGEPADKPQPVPVIQPPREDKRRVEPPPPPKPPRAEPPRPKPPTPVRPPAPPAGDGLNLETVLNMKPAREDHIRPEFLPDFGPTVDAPPKAKQPPAAKPHIENEIRLETLLNLDLEKKEEPRRPEPPKTPDPLSMISKVMEEKPREHARKDHQAEDIDRLLKTTLADFGLETEKKKPAKVILPPPPPAPAPAPAKPKQAAPPAPAPPKPKPAPVPPPPPPAPAFVAAEKPKPAVPPVMPAAVAERAKPPQPPAPPAPAPRQVQPPPKPKPAPVPPPPVAVKPAPEPKPEPKAPAPKPEVKEPVRLHEPQKTAEARIFKDIYEVEKKKSPVPFIAVGAGLVIVAAVAFFILKPKHPASPASQAAENSMTQTQSSVPEKAPDTVLPSLSEEKLRAVNPKPRGGAQANQNRPAEPLPTAEDAIVVPQLTDAARLSVRGTPEKKPEAKPTDTKTAENKAGDAKAAEAQATQNQDPPPKVEATPPQGGTTGGNDSASVTAPAARANTGDLVALEAVDEQPKVLQSVDPRYPAQAMRAGKEGSVTVNVLISETGAVINTGILKGLKDDMGLEKAALDAVKKWKFQPAKKDGVNVKVWKPIVIAFKANRSRTS